jgi:hypothetical protein
MMQVVDLKSKIYSVFNLKNGTINMNAISESGNKNRKNKKNIETFIFCSYFEINSLPIYL